MATGIYFSVPELRRNEELSFDSKRSNYSNSIRLGEARQQHRGRTVSFSPSSSSVPLPETGDRTERKSIKEHYKHHNKANTGMDFTP